MLSEGSSFNTAALTGESTPATIVKGEKVLAGMINVDKVVEIEVVREFNESSLARILVLVQEATSRKARTEQFIRRFAKVYTPIVTFLAIALALFPFCFLDTSLFETCINRGLVF